MALDLKELERIAKACRKAGITKFKNSDFEIELTPEAPVSNYKKKQEQQALSGSGMATDFMSDALTAEELLLWSTGVEGKDEVTT